jgi:hypothetical protein
MDPSVFLKRLEGYISDLRGVLSRFVKTRDSIHIQLDDQAKLQQLALELRDFLHDALGPNDYSEMVVGHFNEGVNNYYGSSSYASVEQIISIASAVKTRVSNSPDLLANRARPTLTAKSPKPLPMPSNVTLGWLFNHVPYKFWVALVGIVVVSFCAGVTAAAKVTVVQQWFGLACGK